MKNKLSIIISVYNTEKYVEKCIDSIVNQTYKNIEIIIIDDGSTDNSRKLLLKYQKNKNVKLILNDENHGLAYSRNIGMETATGDYLGFIDSDDFIAPDYFEKLMSAIVDDNADVAICDFKLIYDDHEDISICCDGAVNAKNIVNNGLAASCCNKVFKKDLITKYQFEVGKINEDIAVVIPAIVHAKKITYVPNCYYNYYQRNNSIQNSKFSIRRFDIIEAVELTSERIEDVKNKEEYIDSLVFNQIILLLYFVITKEKKIFRRFKILRKFNKLIKNIDIVNNKANKEYISHSGKIHTVYYTLLCKFTKSGFCLLADLLIMTYHLIRIIRKPKKVIKNNITMNDLIKLSIKQSKMKDEPIKVSVVIPNYNYEKFLFQRLYSILNQNYKLYEILILDDCSKDNSIELINDIVSKLNKNINIRTIINAKNSGTAFKQWKKGFENVSGDYVWIAEADDYCESNMLKTLIKPVINDDKIIISYADTAFIDTDGKIFMRTIKPEIDIQKTGHWDSNFISDGIEEVKKYAFLNCTIANVSSCIIKNDNYSDLIEESCEYRQAGDWVFYTNLMKSGKVSFINKPLNYYRVHGNNVSSTMNRQKHIDEINKIHNKLYKEFKLDSSHKKKMKERIDFLIDVWKLK